MKGSYQGIKEFEDVTNHNLIGKKVLSDYLENSIFFRRTKPWIKRAVDLLSKTGVPKVAPQIVREFPHDTTAFTQGLAYHEGFLYESTGRYKGSSIRCIDPINGKTICYVPIRDDFAEGIAIINNKLFQVSWQSGQGRIFNLPDLTQTGSFKYSGEGWGLTASKNILIMSNGTSSLKFFNDNFHKVRTLRVCSNTIPMRNINDLEVVNGLIYTNIYGTTDILEISIKTGKVKRIIELPDILSAAPKDVPFAVMNGIAYNSDKDTFFLTGKLWDTMFEVKFNL